MYNINYDEQVEAFHISWEEDPKYSHSIPIIDNDVLLDVSKSGEVYGVESIGPNLIDTLMLLFNSEDERIPQENLRPLYDFVGLK